MTGCFTADDQRHMRLALRLASRAAKQDEVPVGAVVVYDGRIVGQGRNQVEARRSALRHAEMIALEQAAKTLGRWRLTGCTVYVTLEPCAMCAGAIVLARIKRLVYGADDPKAGAAGTIFNIVDHPALNHRPEVRAGVMATEAARVLREFFAERRELDLL